MFPLVAKSFSWGEEVRGKPSQVNYDILRFCQQRNVWSCYRFSQSPMESKIIFVIGFKGALIGLLKVF